MDTFSNEQEIIMNPFATPAASRVTASGFTASVTNDEIDGISTYIQPKNVKKKKESNNLRGRKDSVVDTEITALRGSKTIIPNDSVSMVDRTRKYEPSINTISTGSLYDNVIGGYGQSAEEKMDELDSIMGIQKVSGLPIIFHNERLNFLIHLHKPLQNLLSTGDIYPAEDSLNRISEFMSRHKGKERDPHRQLLYQVVRVTIRKLRVVSNPFNIPILEVGMEVTPKLIYMAFTQLYFEFQMQWFKSMKDIDAPRFHNQYKSFKGRLIERMSSSRNSTRKRSSSVVSGFF